MVAFQKFFLFLIHFLGYLILYLNTDNLKIMIFYGVQVFFFIGYIFLFEEIYRKASRQMITNACLLMAIGFIMQTRLDAGKAVKQLIIVVVSAGVTLLVPYLISNGKNFFSKGTWLYGLGGLAALALVYAGGSTEYGAKLSLNLGGVSFQLSEFVKITFVFFVAGMLNKSLSFLRIVATTVIAAAHVLILVACRDLGTALIFFLPYVFMIFVATQQFFYLFSGLGAGTVAAYIAYTFFSHVRTRVQVWQNPWADITGDGWQIAQSLFAVSTGGWLGMGLYQGMPYKIPVVIKDFIFSAISEEMGAVFAIGVILVCFGCLVQFLQISTWMKKRFYKIVAFGLASVYGIQVLLNVGGVIKLLPSTGITLPFVSYGGSSVLSTFLLFGVMQGLFIMKQKEDEKVEREQEKGIRKKAERP